MISSGNIFNQSWKKSRRTSGSVGRSPFSFLAPAHYGNTFVCKSDIPQREQSLKFLFSGMLFFALFLCSVLGTAREAFAQSWAENLFTIKSHDFGSIPLNSDTRHSFEFRNMTRRDIHVVSATSSCSCTDVIVPKKVIRPGEKGEIVAKVNTSGQHLRKKGAVITVQFDRPTTAFVQLDVSVYIRPDVVLNPGMIDFGTVREGKSLTQNVQLHYAGNPNWELKRIDRANNNPFISAVATRQDASGNSREVSYNVQITLSDKAPPGFFREILRFVTSEGSVDSHGRSSAIELPVSGLIMDALVAKPSPFQFGSVAPGATVTKYLVLRASEPFRVVNVTCPEDRRFVFTPTEQVSSIHVVAVTLTSRQSQEESIARTIYVKTDLKDQETVKVRVYARFLTNEDVANHDCYAPAWKDQILSSLNPSPEEEELVSNNDSDLPKGVSVPTPKYLNLHTQTEPSKEEIYSEEHPYDEVFVEDEPIEHPQILRHYIPDDQSEELIGNEKSEKNENHSNQSDHSLNNKDKSSTNQRELPYSSSLPLPKKLGANPTKKATQQLTPDPEPIISRRTPLKQAPQWRKAPSNGQTGQDIQEEQQIHEQDRDDSIFATPVSPEERDSANHTNRTNHTSHNSQQVPKPNGEKSEHDWIAADRSSDSQEVQTPLDNHVENGQEDIQHEENRDLHAKKSSENSGEAPFWKANGNSMDKGTLIMDFVDANPQQAEPDDLPGSTNSLEHDISHSQDLAMEPMEIAADVPSGALFDVPQVIHTTEPNEPNISRSAHSSVGATAQNKSIVPPPTSPLKNSVKAGNHPEMSRKQVPGNAKQVAKPTPLRNRTPSNAVSPNNTPSKPVVMAPVWTSKANR